MCKRTYPSERSYRKISEPGQNYIVYLILTRPGIYLYEIVSELSTVLGVQCVKFIKKIGFTHQKLATYALQRDNTRRQQYVSDVAIYPRG